MTATRRRRLQSTEYRVQNYSYTASVDALVPDGNDEYSWRDVPLPHERMDCDIFSVTTNSRAYAAVGESSIWMSMGCHGTLALDTASGAWSKVGDWPLSFVGRGVHAPHTEHGDLWFRFSARSTHLEAWDLHADGGPASRLKVG
jgi:hypothetical protein